jgi:hypothetical protein
MSILNLKSLLGPINAIGKKTTGFFVPVAQDLFGNPGTTGPKTNDQSKSSILGLRNRTPKKYNP